MRAIGLLQSKGGEIHTVEPNAALREAAARMRAHNIGSLVVMEGDRFVGLLGERDIVEALAVHGDGAGALEVAAVMQSDVATCHGSDTLERLMSTMTKRRARHLPVVADGEVVGVLSIGDVVKRRLAELEDENCIIQGYVDWGR